MGDREENAVVALCRVDRGLHRFARSPDRSDSAAHRPLCRSERPFMKKIFIAGLSLSALLFTGCHTPNESSHSQTGSLFVSADNHRNKQPLPRTELRSTEIPKVV